MTASALAFEPLVPTWALGALVSLALVVSVLSIWRGARGGPLRLLAAGALALLLANPQLRTSERTPLDDVAVILVDQSASQRLDGRDGIARAAADALAARLAALGGIEVVRREVGGENETRLVEALAGAAADTPRGRLAAVFAITDGQASDAARAGDLALDAPAHVLLTGRDDEFDRKITLLSAPRYGLVRESARIAFRVDDVGPEGAAAGTGSAVVALRVNGREVARQAVPLGAEVSFEAPLEHPGALILELEAEERPGELTTRNNIAVLNVTAIRDRLRVLLISGEPHAGERVWRNLLKSDPAVDLVHFTILRPIEKGNPGELASELALIPFPQDELFIDRLSAFDLLIFDRYTYRGVLNAFHFDNIARYVENGGAVLVASGPEYAGALSLAARRNFSFILPALPEGAAREGPFRPRISEDGARHPVTAGLPEQEFWGRWLRIMPAAQRSGRTLMTGPDGAPLLILDRVGEGRVGLLLSDHVWLWARGFDGGGPHAELLRRIAHWLMKEPELEEERLTLTGAGDDLVIRRRTMSDEPGPVSLVLPSGETREIALDETAPGRFEARLANAEHGLYRARAGELFAVGAVGLAAPPEFDDVVADSRPLAPAAEASRGGVFRIRRGDGIALPALRKANAGAAAYAGAGWAGLVERGAYRIDATRDAPLAPPWFWLALIAAALLGAWLLEGRTGRRRPRAGFSA
ncbi:hypothetical protein [Amphiplicatus metriothermophilus]|uniref:Glutamine amidotransferase domain-containing protein n=1 Tax=Amphiplicatus metriothermophilus TaxID=1519374 RepID=A0A239PS92_9PROT|nr:hypothetical protein [Amphiplicatus metriothermophilus]MBB5519089.1 hypothetical protein [Amphiplicatus metriothermophilus]SNT73159.1 hypothetical protein SAMN06297382_1556 [Amphiplicatus metriothermophilus]